MPSWFPTTLADAVAFVPLRIVFLVVLALVARSVAHRLIDRTVRRATGERRRPRIRAMDVLRNTGRERGEGRREARILALGSLARSTTTVVITIIALLMIFSEMGFQITSIIAGTSIIAVTIAFGLQNVVKDLVSGVFMLVEGQFGVGDFVDLKEASGTVEAIGLRITTLRDDDANAWYVRNGEVLRVGNFSQGGSGRPPLEPDGPEVWHREAPAPPSSATPVRPGPNRSDLPGPPAATASRAPRPS